MTHHLPKILAIYMIILSGSLSRADTLVLHEGRTISGQITGETARSISIESSNGRFTFGLDKVKTVNRESQVNNKLRNVEMFLSEGNLDVAMAILQNDLSQDHTPKKTNVLLLKHLQPIATGIISTSATAVLLAKSLMDSKNAPIELLLIAAALSIDTDNTEEAFLLMTQVEANIPAQFFWSTDTITALLNRIANSAIKKKQGAILALSANLANRLPLPRQSSSDNHLSLYGQIEELTRKKQFLQATSLFNPDLFLRRADLFIPQAERLLIGILAASNNDSSLAALESARVTLMPYISNGIRLRGMKVLINRLIEADRAEHALTIIDQVASQNADAGSILQHLLDFQKSRKLLPSNDPVRSYKLAAWGRSMGLLDESKALFLALRKDPRLSENADLQLAIIENAQLSEDLQQLKRLYETDNIELLKSEGSDFLKQAPPEEFAQQVRNLLQLADFQSWSVQRSSEGKAEAEYQQAERLTNRGEFDEALAHLNRIQIDREGSAAAKKTDMLRNRIMGERIKEKSNRR